MDRPPFAADPGAAGCTPAARGSSPWLVDRRVATLVGMRPPDTTDPYRLDVEDWLRLPDAPGLQEIVDGELWLMPPPGIGHQRISGRLALRLGAHLETSAAGELFVAPTGVCLTPNDVLQPDLLVVRKENAGRVGEDYVDGPPDLVVEILSPGSAGRDRHDKRQVYDLAGVPEYWIVDPLGEEIEVLRRAALRVVAPAGSGGDAGELRCVIRLHRGDVLTTPLLPGLALDLDDVFQRESEPTEPGARELGSGVKGTG